MKPLDAALVRNHRPELVAIIRAIQAAPPAGPHSFDRIARRHPRRDGGIFSKPEVIQAFRALADELGWQGTESVFLDRVRLKPVRTMSGVAPVTLLTKPFPCPGQCVFCPNDVRMPKSYLSREPGAQRATQHAFDPYRQTLGRLQALYNNGHPTDKVELIVLGGTWSSYPETYQLWFLEQAFRALNTFSPTLADDALAPPDRSEGVDFLDLEEAADAARLGERPYNQIVRSHLQRHHAGRLLARHEHATFAGLECAQRVNESAAVRCVGLALETRPDEIGGEEVVRLRRLGATKIQLGIQSLDDEVLARNRRGHDVAASHEAVRLLRSAGFKIHAHWMPNLLGSDPERDRQDFARLFDDPRVRPDELKIYPCSLIETAELMLHHRAGHWHAYKDEELRALVADLMAQVPEYCRITRVFRDIPSTDIVTGHRSNNLREEAERRLEADGRTCRDIRSRQIRRPLRATDRLSIRANSYATSTGGETFLQCVTEADELIGFLRLSLPARPVAIPEIASSAMIREVHVYGAMAGLGERDPRKSQHLGVGRQLIEAAARRSEEAGFEDLAVISAIGTRPYYRDLGFKQGSLYQHRRLRGKPASRAPTRP